MKDIKSIMELATCRLASLLASVIKNVVLAILRATDSESFRKSESECSMNAREIARFLNMTLPIQSQTPHFIADKTPTDDISIWSDRHRRRRFLDHLRRFSISRTVLLAIPGRFICPRKRPIRLQSPTGKIAKEQFSPA